MPLNVRGITEQYSALPALGAVLCREKFDIVHTGDGLVALWLQRFLRRLNRRLPKIILNNAASSMRFCGNFEFVESVAPYYKVQAEGAGIDTRRWFVNPYWTDPAVFRPPTKEEKLAIRRSMGIPLRSFVVVSAGAIDMTNKRMDYVVKEFADAKRRNRRSDLFLLLVGASAGTETARVKGICEQLLGSGFAMVTNVPHGLMPQYYRCADLYCLASLHEFFGLATIEAMATALPVLVDDFPVRRWMVGSGGLCFGMTELGALASQILAYSGDGERVRTEGELARSRVLSMFSPTAVVPRVIEMYKSVAAS